MAEEKKSGPGPVSGHDLASRIAKLYGSTPPEQRDLQPQDDQENLELDKTFEEMIQMQKVRRPERENVVVPFPAPAAARAPQTQRETAAAYACAQCGHRNPLENQFCGMCGAARAGAVIRPAARAAPPQPLRKGLSVSASRVKHPHHRARKLTYALVALVPLLVGVIGWELGWEYRRTPTPPVSAPVQQSSPTSPVQVQPSPQPALPAAVSVSPAEAKPARKPAVRPVNPSPGTRRRVAQPTMPENGTAAPILANPPMPKLQEFSHAPPPLNSQRR